MEISKTNPKENLKNLWKRDHRYQVKQFIYHK
jgi:hypothetical protein